jgi:hypothetical protein
MGQPEYRRIASSQFELPCHQISAKQRKYHPILPRAKAVVTPASRLTHTPSHSETLDSMHYLKMKRVMFLPSLVWGHNFSRKTRTRNVQQALPAASTPLTSALSPCRKSKPLAWSSSSSRTPQITFLTSSISRTRKLSLIFRNPEALDKPSLLLKQSVENQHRLNRKTHSHLVGMGILVVLPLGSVA